MKEGRLGYLKLTKQAGYLGLLLVLLLYVTNPSAEDTESVDETLINAAAKGNLPLVKKILETDEKISMDTINSAYFAGIKKGSRLIVERLLERGADVDFRGKNGYTALIQAARDGRSHLVKILLPLGADVNAIATETNETSLILAAKRNRKEVVNQLLEAGANVNTKRSDGMTALMLAARGGHQQTAHALIEAGADINYQLENGATALMLAAQHGHLGAIYVLLAAKADVNLKASNGATALTLANAYRHTEAVKMLKKAGAH